MSDFNPIDAEKNWKRENWSKKRYAQIEKNGVVYLPVSIVLWVSTNKNKFYIKFVQ